MRLKRTSPKPKRVVSDGCLQSGLESHTSHVMLHFTCGAVLYSLFELRQGLGSKVTSCLVPQVMRRVLRNFRRD